MNAHRKTAAGRRELRRCPLGRNNRGGRNNVIAGLVDRRAVAAVKANIHDVGRTRRKRGRRGNGKNRVCVYAGRARHDPG